MHYVISQLVGVSLCHSDRRPILFCDAYCTVVVLIVATEIMLVHLCNLIVM